MLEIIFILVNLLFGILIFYLLIAFLTGAPFVPSTAPVSRAMLDLAHIRKGMRVYDLGSGDGRLLFLAANRGAIAVGIEINPYLVCFTNIRALLSGYHKQVRARWGSFWNTPISDADVVFIYLLPWRMEKLERIFTKQLKKGALVVSNSFMFPHLTKIREDKTQHVFVYKI